MKKSQPHNHVRELRSLEMQIRRHHCQIVRLENKRDIFATVFRIQARDEHGRFLPFFKEVK